MYLLDTCEIIQIVIRLKKYLNINKYAYNMAKLESVYKNNKQKKIILKARYCLINFIVLHFTKQLA